MINYYTGEPRFHTENYIIYTAQEIYRKYQGGIMPYDLMLEVAEMMDLTLVSEQDELMQIIDENMWRIV